jgi:predicted transcriptional regulator
MTDQASANLVELAAKLTIAWLGNVNNRVSADEVPAFLRTMHQSVREMSEGRTASAAEGQTPQAPDEVYAPAVSVRKSLGSKDHIISMIDGKPYKTLRRHLTTHGLTPEQYRERYNLNADYPMVAENYSAARRDMAKKIGLGRKARGGGSAAADAGIADSEPSGRGRRPDATATE